VATTRAWLSPLSAEYPASNFATFLYINERPLLRFDAATDQSCRWTLVVPQGFTGTMTLVISYIMATATSGAVRFQVQVEAVSDGDTLDLDASTSFDTANSNGETVPGTAGHISQLSVTLTNQDSAAAADMLRIHINRDADGTSGTDDATGFCDVIGCELRDAA
jgi:hypothetical protein